MQDLYFYIRWAGRYLRRILLDQSPIYLIVFVGINGFFLLLFGLTAYQRPALAIGLPYLLGYTCASLVKSIPSYLIQSRGSEDLALRMKIGLVLYGLTLPLCLVPTVRWHSVGGLLALILFVVAFAKADPSATNPVSHPLRYSLPSFYLTPTFRKYKWLAIGLLTTVLGGFYWSGFWIAGPLIAFVVLHMLYFAQPINTFSLASRYANPTQWITSHIFTVILSFLILNVVLLIGMFTLQWPAKILLVGIPYLILSSGLPYATMGWWGNKPVHQLVVAGLLISVLAGFVLPIFVAFALVIYGAILYRGYQKLRLYYAENTY